MMRLADYFVILSMRAYPEPEHAIRDLHGDGTVVYADPHGPELANPLEMERWV